MRRRDLSMWAWKCLALPAFGFALIAAAPAQAAFPGVPGPIAYSKTTADEVEDTGGLLAHGPSKKDAPLQLTENRNDSSPSWSPDGKHIAFLSIGRYSSGVTVMRADGRGFSKEFDEGGTEEEGYGSHVGAPGWGAQPR